MDEEYFRNNLAIALVRDYNSIVAPLFEKFRRAYKQQPSKFRELRKRLLKDVDLVTPSGIFLGKTMTYQFSIERTLNVVLKIARGLHHHHLGQLKESQCHPTVRFYSDSFTQEMPKPEPQIFEILKFAQIHGGWGDTFQYAGYHDENGSAWWMRFYKGHLGMAIFGFCNEP